MKEAQATAYRLNIQGAYPRRATLRRGQNGRTQGCTAVTLHADAVSITSLTTLQNGARSSNSKWHLPAQPRNHAVVLILPGSCGAVTIQKMHLPCTKVGVSRECRRHLCSRAPRPGGYKHWTQRRHACASHPATACYDCNPCRFDKVERSVAGLKLFDFFPVSWLIKNGIRKHPFVCTCDQQPQQRRLMIRQGL